MFQIRSHSTSMFSSWAKRLESRLGVAQHLRELRRVEVALVEQALGGLDDRGHDARLRDDAAHRADRAAADARGDLAQLELELRGAGERVAPLVHRSRARVRRLAAPGDAMALDAERPEHDAERDVHALEHRPLLDVQLEVGGGVLELTRSPRSRGRGRCRALRSRPAARRRRRRSAAAARPGRASSPRPRSSRTASGRSARPSSSAQLTSRTVTGGSPSAAMRRSTSEPATTLSAPSSQPPFGTESRWPPMTSVRVRGARNRPPLVARLVELHLDPVELAGHPVLGLHPGVRPGHALSPVRVSGQLLQLAKLGDGSLRVESHRPRA